MSEDPLRGIFIRLILLAGYSALGASAWLVFCGGNAAAVRKLNAAIRAREGPVFSLLSATDRLDAEAGCDVAPDLAATLTALVAEKRLSQKLAGKLLRIKPVFQDGRWAVYPSNAYWTHRFERLHSR